MIFGSFLHAARTLRKNTGYSLLIVFTLALGIGATTAVFSVAYNALAGPLPYPEPEQLVQIFESTTPNDEARMENVAPANFVDWQQQNSSFSAIGASCGFTYNLTGATVPERLNGAAVSASYFQVFGVKPTLGRMFVADEDRNGSVHVVVISDRLWRKRFGADRGIVGRTISLNGDPYVVVGVMPAQWSRDYDEQFELWIPLQQQIRPDRMLWRNMRFLRVFGRLKEGSTIDQARADLNRISVNIKGNHPGSDVDGAAVAMRFRKAMVRGSETGLLVCLGIAGIVLLIACANVTNLMLVRVDARARELAVRMALGASKNQIMAQLLAESSVLALAGGGFGVLLAIAGQKALTALLPAHAPDFRGVQLNLPMLMCAVIVSLATGVLFGMAPAFAATRPAVQDVLRRATSRSSGDRAAKRWRDMVASAEIALAVILLVSTGLLTRSLLELHRAPLGFRADQTVTFRVALPRINYQEDAKVAEFGEKVEQQLRVIPGITDVAMGNRLPLMGGQFGTTFKLSDIQEEPYPVAELRLIDARYFSMLSIPVVHGRRFTDHDRMGSQPVAIISESMARRFWPDKNPLGQLVIPTRADTNGMLAKHVIVGIVGDVRDAVSEEARPTIYIPFAQMSFPTMHFLLLSPLSPGELTDSLQRAVQVVDADQPITNVSSVEELVKESTEPWRYALTLIGGLALLAIVLTMIGIFAVTSYLVRDRWKELGIRLAIGASPSHVLKSVLASGAMIALCGVAVGSAAAIVLTRFLGGLIYGVPAGDPVTLIAVLLLTFGIVLLASYVPAKRASNIDPWAALREE